MLITICCFAQAQERSKLLWCSNLNDTHFTMNIVKSDACLCETFVNGEAFHLL